MTEPEAGPSASILRSVGTCDVQQLVRPNVNLADLRANTISFFGQFLPSLQVSSRRFWFDLNMDRKKRRDRFVRLVVHVVHDCLQLLVVFASRLMHKTHLSRSIA